MLLRINGSAPSCRRKAASVGDVSGCRQDRPAEECSDVLFLQPVPSEGGYHWRTIMPTVLIVEDEVEVAEMLRVIMSGAGYQTVVVDRIAEGDRRLRQGGIDLVI